MGTQCSGCSGAAALPAPFSLVCCALPQPRTARARFGALHSAAAAAAAAAAAPAAGSLLPLPEQGSPPDPALYPWTRSLIPIL